MSKSIFAEIPDNVELSVRAVRDLKALLKKNRQETERVLHDVIRLAKKNLPVTQSKKLSGMGNLWQLDSGRYRVAYYWEKTVLYIVTMFPKSAQAKKFRHL